MALVITTPNTPMMFTASLELRQVTNWIAAHVPLHDVDDWIKSVHLHHHVHDAVRHVPLQSHLQRQPGLRAVRVKGTKSQVTETSLYRM